ncbi:MULTISPECIES: hypothetical protein [Mesorhizobium]|uniref:Uncharacterized protein n=1 Tax=Rhizobium loti TaxID=381 RepID=A0A6M7TUJ0_RHILI|nr:MULTISPECIES: hypothetical protein [Mesorhizobium]KRB20739.1 hypothetical protein ASE05_18830 [Mesorhizobium sp. Root172]OBQ65442.1 hypothetical protein A8145_14825 [Mesorhizobium loti]QKC68565.1 hypothetical protein EB815_05115 [Mesorhizobium loti]
MHKRAKTWSLPYRLRSDGWWMADPPRANPAAILIPFVRKSPPPMRSAAIWPDAIRPDAIRKVRS